MISEIIRTNTATVIPLTRLSQGAENVSSFILHQEHCYASPSKMLTEAQVTTDFLNAFFVVWHLALSGNMGLAPVYV